jgi:hypothetical protein
MSRDLMLEGYLWNKDSVRAYSILYNEGFSNRDRYILRRCDIKLLTQVVGAITKFSDRRTTVVTTT